MQSQAAGWNVEKSLDRLPVRGCPLNRSIRGKNNSGAAEIPEKDSFQYKGAEKDCANFHSVDEAFFFYLLDAAGWERTTRIGRAFAGYLQPIICAGC